MAASDDLTPLHAAMRCHKIFGEDTERDCRRVAVLLAERGATLVGGNGIEDATDHRYSAASRGVDRWKAISILLGLAGRSGR